MCFCCCLRIAATLCIAGDPSHVSHSSISFKRVRAMAVTAPTLPVWHFLPLCLPHTGLRTRLLLFCMQHAFTPFSVYPTFTVCLFLCTQFFILPLRHMYIVHTPIHFFYFRHVHRKDVLLIGSFARFTCTAVLSRFPLLTAPAHCLPFFGSSFVFVAFATLYTHTPWVDDVPAHLPACHAPCLPATMHMHARIFLSFFFGMYMHLCMEILT